MSTSKKNQPNLMAVGFKPQPPPASVHTRGATPLPPPSPATTTTLSFKSPSKVHHSHNDPVEPVAVNMSGVTRRKPATPDMYSLPFLPWLSHSHCTD